MQRYNEVLMAQDRTTNDGQVRIGTHKVVGEDTDKVQQLLECGLVDLHRDMLGIEHDTMLVIVNIGRILQAPIRAANLKGNHTMVLTGRMIHQTTGFAKEHILGVLTYLGNLCLGYLTAKEHTSHFRFVYYTTNASKKYRKKKFPW